MRAFFEVNARITKGWELRITALSDAFTVEDWRAKSPEAIALAEKSGAALDCTGAARRGRYAGVGAGAAQRLMACSARGGLVEKRGTLC